MCSCSGSCNCNSTTIPRGPQGIPGTNGTNGSDGLRGPAGPVGPVGGVGPSGSNGINAFTTLTVNFVQPAIGGNTIINVVNNSWMAVSEIIYIGPALSGLPTEAGGFYQVVSKTSIDQVNIINLGWVIPGTIFVATGATVGAVGTIVTPSGTIGASGNNAYVLNAQWGAFLGSGGANDLKTSILVPANTLNVDDDVLECQTVFRIRGPLAGILKYFKIKISTVNNDGSVGTVAYQNNIDLPILASSSIYATIHMNYKIQYVSSILTRTKGEAFLSIEDEYEGASLTDLEVIKSYLCTTLFGGFNINWTNNQYITVVVDDEAVPAVTVVHHEIKVIKKLI